MSDWPKSLVLAGAGKMGGAMLRGWLTAGITSGLRRHRTRAVVRIDRALGERGLCANRAQPSIADVLVLAIKPQTLDAAARDLASIAGPQTLVLSIMAGKTVANIKARLPRAHAFVASCRTRPPRSAEALPRASPTAPSAMSSARGPSG